MKTSLFSTVLLPVLAACPIVFAEEPRQGGKGPEVLPAGLQPPDRDLPGDAELEERRKLAGALVPKPVPRQATHFGLANLSEFISHGGSFAILPKGSVIFRPTALASRILERPAGKPMIWAEFLVANRNWISTHEVTLAQVRGEKAFSDNDLKSFESGGRIVVATLGGNPITVLKPAPVNSSPNTPPTAP